MMSATLKMFAGATDQVDVILHRIAHGHYKKGVRVSQYPVVGSVLFDTFAFCLGDAWDEPTRCAWHRIFSHMFRVLIPVGMADERAGDNATPTQNQLSETVLEPMGEVQKTTTAHHNNDHDKVQLSSSTCPTVSSSGVLTEDAANVPFPELVSEA
jgi:hypothetical protein